MDVGYIYICRSELDRLERGKVSNCTVSYVLWRRYSNLLVETIMGKSQPTRSLSTKDNHWTKCSFHFIIERPRRGRAGNNELRLQSLLQNCLPHSYYPGLLGNQGSIYGIRVLVLWACGFGQRMDSDSNCCNLYLRPNVPFVFTALTLNPHTVMETFKRKLYFQGGS